MSDSESECEFSVIQIKTECKNTVTSVDQFDKICRLCLSAETQICSIFELQYNKSNFSDLLHLCTSIHVSTSNVPCTVFTELALGNGQWGSGPGPAPVVFSCYRCSK